MGAAVKAAGGGFLEAPVSGSKGPAEQGALIFLTAGDEAVKDAAAADLEAMGKAVRAPVTRPVCLNACNVQETVTQDFIILSVF